MNLFSTSQLTSVQGQTASQRQSKLHRGRNFVDGWVKTYDKYSLFFRRWEHRLRWFPTCQFTQFEVGWTGKVVYCLRSESARNIRSHNGARDERQSSLSYVEFLDLSACGENRETSPHRSSGAQLIVERQDKCNRSIGDSDRSWFSARQLILVVNPWSRSCGQLDKNIRIKTYVDACIEFPMQFSCSTMFQLTLSVLQQWRRRRHHELFIFHGPKPVDSWESEISKTWDVVLHHQREAQRLHTWRSNVRFATLPHLFLSLGNS